MEELPEILGKLKENPELYDKLKTEEHLVDNRAEDMKFWVIVSQPLQLFTDKDEAIAEMQQVLTEDSECSLAEISWLEEENQFDVNPVGWKEMNVALAKQLTELREKLETKDK